MLNLDEFIKLADKVGMVAQWATERETNKVKAMTKHNEIFIFNGKGIKIFKKGEENITNERWIAHGTFLKMIFEHFYPSYTIHSFKYLMNI